VLIVVAFVAIYLVTTGPVPPPPGWGSDFEAAVADAEASERNLVIAFYLPGCPACVAMDRTVLGSEAVQDALKRFVPVRLDAGESFALAERLGVFGAPTYVVVDTRGALLAKCGGYQSVEAFIGFLDRALLPRARRAAVTEVGQPGGP
jgi:thioredoxin-related protein